LFIQSVQPLKGGWLHVNLSASDQVREEVPIEEVPILMAAMYGFTGPRISEGD